MKFDIPLIVISVELLKARVYILVPVSQHRSISTGQYLCNVVVNIDVEQSGDAGVTEPLAKG